MGQYSNGAVIFYDESAVATNLGGITNIDFPTNVEIISDDGGSIYDETLSITNFAPVASITTKSIKTVLETIALDGQCVQPAPELVTQVDVISRRLKTCQDTLSGTPHFRYRVTQGLLKLGSLSADRGQDAAISFMIDTLTDGTNAPVAETDGVAMPSPLLTQQYTLGVCKLGGVVFSEIEGISIDFGVQITDKTPALASIWPDSVGVLKVRPVLSLRGRDLSRVKAAMIPLAGKAGTHLNSVIQLVKRQNAGSFETIPGTTHISLTLNGLIVPENLMSGSGNARATNALRMATSYDGSSVPIVSNLSAAYDSTP